MATTTTCRPGAAGALTAVLLLAAACGAGTSAPESERGSGSAAGTVVLKAVCPLVHTSYDALVSSAPPSQQAFVAALVRIRNEADAATRAALAPLLTAAQDLATAGRGASYAEARDSVYTAVVGLSDRCSEEGRPIMHPGH